MCLRVVLTAVLIVTQATVAVAQTVEERLDFLEREVAELRSFHGLPTQPNTELPAELIGNEHVRWGYPGGDCAFLVREHYVACHDGAKRIPEWVTYHLTRENLQGDVARTENFRPDPELPENERAELVDYQNSGYDRGLLAPGAAFKRSWTAMSETFLLSNMAPQRPNLNRRLWRELEDDVRSLAKAIGNIWVFTGSLFLDANGYPTEPLNFIGPNQVAVPTHFYKVILCTPTTGTFEMFGFLVANQLQPLSGDPVEYLVSVDVLEAASGLDFFDALSDHDEDRLEELVATDWPIR